MLGLLVALFLVPNRFLVLDREVEVPAAEWRAIDLALDDSAARIDCRFRVLSGGPGVRVALLPRDAVEHLRAGRAHRVLAGSPFAGEGGFRYMAQPGGYALVVDNGMDGRGAAKVRLRASVVFPDRPQQSPAVLSPERRAVVVASSAVFFLTVALTAGRKLRRAFANRPQGPPLPFWD